LLSASAQAASEPIFDAAGEAVLQHQRRTGTINDGVDPDPIIVRMWRVARLLFCSFSSGHPAAMRPDRSKFVSQHHFPVAMCNALRNLRL